MQMINALVKTQNAICNFWPHLQILGGQPPDPAFLRSCGGHVHGEHEPRHARCG